MDELTRNDGRSPIFFAAFFTGCLALAIYVYGKSAELFGEYPFYHDNQMFSYPLRVFFARNLSQHSFSLYDPYAPGGVVFNSIFLNLGMSPIVWTISLLFGYSPTSFIYEILLYFAISVVGCYFWLREAHDPWPALFGALAYSLVLNNVFQGPMNVECLATAAFVPCFMAGLTRNFRGQLSGIPITVLSLYGMFTSGYLGSSLIVAQLATFYCVCEALLAPMALSRASIWRSARYSLVSLLLFLGLYQFLLFETFSYYPMGKFFDRHIDPFAGVTDIYSLITLFFPAQISPHVSGQWGASRQWFLMYFGWTPVFFAVCALIAAPSRKVLLLLFFCVLSFAMVLPSTSPVARVLVDHVPFYKGIRFHVWNTYMCNLFMVSIACRGFQKYPEISWQKRAVTVGVFAVIVLGVVYWRGWFSLPPLVLRDFYPCLALVSVLLILERRVPLPQAWKNALVVLLLLAELSIVYGRKADRHLVVGPGDSLTALNRFFADTEEAASQWRATSRPFPNDRTREGASTKHYMLKRAAYAGSYSPQIHLAIEKLLREGKERLLQKILYAVDSHGLPTVETSAVLSIPKYETDQVEFRIQTSEPESFTWSTPFSRNWQLEVDHRSESFRPNDFGLITFALPSGDSSVVFTYNPPHLWPSVLITCLSFVALIAIGVHGQLRHRR